jgi:hypothetical protein
MRPFLFFFLFIFVLSCVDPYHFVVDDNEPFLVVEGYISDKSFHETLSYPSDGRHFSIRLTTTSDVTNVRPVPVENGTVTLKSSEGGEWHYEISDKPGVYLLRESDFHAEQGVQYSLVVRVDDEVYESDWEAMPESSVPPIGTVDFEETESEKYVMEGSKSVMRAIKEIKASITVNENTESKPIYYRWKFDPMWVYVAPLSPSITRPGYKCWVSNDNSIKTFTLQVDNSGGYRKELFRIPTLANERILDDYSVLIQQFAMTDDYYYFWREMYDQNEGNVLVDRPPFNLQSNIRSVTSEKKAVGYFGVVKEQALRWYFNVRMLSYPVENVYKKGCETNYGPPIVGDCPEEPSPAFPACACKYCPRYPFGEPTNVKPSWWPR